MFMFFISRVAILFVKSTEESSKLHTPGVQHPTKFMLPGIFLLPYTYNPHKVVYFYGQDAVSP